MKYFNLKAIHESALEKQDSNGDVFNTFEVYKAESAIDAAKLVMRLTESFKDFSWSMNQVDNGYVIIAKTKESIL